MASDTTSIINIPIIPGGMFGDIVEDELGFHQHQRIENLRQIKKGEWELPPGYRNTLTSLTNTKAGIEVDEDVSGDRFRLIQSGVNIIRVDYDITNSPLFGYENETPVALNLPSGVTIATSATLRFFQFRGVVRISGASEPLHYSYVDRTVFGGEDSFTITDWVLERAALQWVDNDVEVLTATPIASEFVDTLAIEISSLALFMKFFYQFDDGQYQLLRKPDATAVSTQGVFGYPEEIFPSQLGENTAHIEIRIPGAALKNAMFNRRITGLGIAFATVPYTFGLVEGAVPGSYDGDLEPFFVPEVLRISTEPDDTLKIKEVGFALVAANWVSGTPTILQISDPDDDFPGPTDYGRLFLPPEGGYLGNGVKVTISFGDSPNASIDTVVVSLVHFGSASPAILTVEDDMTAVFGATGTKGNVGFRVTVEWHYDAANGYKTYYGLNLLVLGTLYETFAGIPTGTLRNTPNWEAMQFLSERSYISGQTGDIGSTVVSGGTIEEVTVVEDNFIDTNGVLLTAHTMDLGNGWVSGDGVATIFEIQSNEAADSSGNLGETVYTESNRSDNIKITGRMVLNANVDAVSIKFRYVDENNFWTLNYIGSNLPFISLVRFVGGVATTRDTTGHTIADGVSVTFEIELVGDIITGRILTPETQTVTTTDSAHQTATRHGFASDNANTALVVVDSFKITEDVLVPTSSAVANDDFIDTNGVALTAHTMPLGNGWTSTGVQWEIQSNEATDSGVGSGEQVITELNKSDKLIITGQIMINDPDDETRISFRHFTIINEWLFAYSGSNAPVFEIRRVIAGVTTVQATQAHTVADGTFVSFQITLDGSSIELQLLSPEVYTLQVTDLTHLTETKLAFFPLATNAGLTRIIDLVVVEIVESFLIESKEEDTSRYSAIGQFDNLPIGNVIQTEVGTTDKILNLAKRDNQLTILKARSISTGNFVGAFYKENIGFTKHGLFSVLGVFSVSITINAEESNEFILIMDQDDLYLYNGNQIVSFFEKVELRKFYRDNVTTNSFVLFDKKNGELLFFLGTEILVWNMHIPEFYIRQTDITPLYGFLDADNNLIIGTATSQVTFNHSLSPYDENHGYLIKTKVVDNRTPHRYKRLKEIQSYLGTTETQLITITETQTPETVLFDEFLSSGPELLDAHVPDIDLIGGGWVYQHSTAGNTEGDMISPTEMRAQTAAANDRNMAYVETGLKDFTLTHVFRRNSPATTPMFTAFRRANTGFFWFVEWDPVADTITLFQVNAVTPAASVQIAQVSAAVPNAASGTYIIECIGPSIVVRISGVTPQISVIDSFNSDATQHGIPLRSTGSHDRHQSFTVEAAFGDVIEETPEVAPTTLKIRRNYPKHLFKEMTLEFTNSATSNVLTAQIRDYLLKVERWQKP